MSSISTNDAESSTAATSGFTADTASTATRLAEVSSTPVKARGLPTTHTHNSVDSSWREELNQYRHGGISAQELLKRAMDVTDEELDDLKRRVDAVAAHSSDEYTRISEDFQRKAANLEVAMYIPFADMANIILKRQRGISSQHIKVLPLSGNKPIEDGFGARKPDVILVPEKDGDKEIDVDTVRWYHMLLVMEFKKNPELEKKRAREADDGEIEKARPAKRHSTSITAANKDPVPAVVNRSSSSTKRSRGRRRLSSTSVRSSASKTKHTRAKASGDNDFASFQQSVPSSEELCRSARLQTKCQASISARPEVQTDDNTAQGAMGPPASPIGLASLLGRPDSLGTNQESEKYDLEDVFGAYDEDDSDSDYEEENEKPLRRTRWTPGSVTNRKSHATWFDNNDVIKREVQLANYMGEVMSCHSDRSYAFGAIVFGTEMRLTYYSRTVYVISNPFDIVQDPETFSLLLMLFSKQPLEKLGFNEEMGYCNPFNTKAKRKLSLTLKPVSNGGDNFELKHGTELEIGSLIHSEYCLMGRATSVYDINRPEGSKVDLVVKFSWQVKERRREDIAIRIARSVNTEHSPEIYGQVITADKAPSQKLIDGCPVSHRPNRLVEARELRVLLMRKYHSVEELENNDEGNNEFYTIVTQFTDYVHDLYRKKGLLHRDISIFNMAFYRKSDGSIVGTLIDFDLATYPEEAALPFLDNDAPAPTQITGTDASGGPNPSAPLTDYTHNTKVSTSGLKALKNGQDRSGTAPFMSIEALDLTALNYAHHVSHELESIFYALVWQAVGYRYRRKVFPKPPRPVGHARQPDYLRDWRVGLWPSVMRAKDGFLTNPEPIAQGIKHTLLQVLCKMLAKLFRKRRDVAQLRADDAELGSYENLADSLVPVKGRKSVVSTKPLLKPVAKLYDVAIYPSFAKALRMKVVGCQMDCCVAK